jgi:hypothetical protein
MAPILVCLTTTPWTAALGLTSPDYVGLAIFQEQDAAAPILVSGSANVNITGTIYAASAAVKISGSGSLHLTGSAANSFASHLLVADLIVTGNGAVSVDTSDNNLELL